MNALLKDNESVPESLQDALDLAAQGFHVFRVKPGQKTPARTGWQKEATRDPDSIRKLFGSGDWNIGIFTGKFGDGGAALLVVDVDVKHRKDGNATMKDIQATGVNFPPTLTSLTPTGGRHLVYRVDAAVYQGVDVLGSGLDIRSHGGLIVAPGSTVDGKVYRFEKEAPIAPAPQWMIDKCGGPRLKSAKGKPALDGINPKRATERAVAFLTSLDTVTEGSRNDAAFKAANAVKDEGCGKDECFTLMLEHWPCEPMLDHDELKQVIASAYANGQNVQGSAAPEAQFEPVIEHDPIEGARDWDRARIESNIDKVRLYRKRKPEAFGQLRQAWELLDALDAHELDELIADATLRTVGVDNVRAAAAPGVLDRPDVQRLLGELKAGDDELFGWIKKGLADHAIPAGRVNAQAAKGKQALAAERLAAARAKDGRVRITYRPGAIADTVDEMERVLLADDANEKVFRHGGEYVAVRTAAPVTVRELAGGGEYPPMAILHRYDAHSMGERISRCIRLETMAGADAQPKAIQPTEGAVRMLLSRRGGAAPVITGIVEAPTVRSDGSLLSDEGYDSATGLFATFGGQAFDVCVDPPTQQDAAAALQFLERELFDEFPFAEPVDRTAAVAALITGMMRPVLEGSAPGFVLASPTQGTGKTALAQAICHGAFGRPAAAQSWPGSDEEMSKYLLGALREGQRAVVFDNLRDGTLIDNAELAAAMTSDTYSRRGLGGHDTITVPTAVLWLITGNNVRPAGDMPSRLIEVYLDANTDRPDRRDFKRDLLAWVAAHRPAIVRAVVTVVRAYLTAGAPKVDGGSSRFPQWDRMVRFPLIYAGGPDVGVKFDKAYASDPGLEAWSEVLQRWRELFGNEPVTARELLKRIDSDAQPFDAKCDGLRQALQDSMGRQRHDKVTALSVGKHLGKFDRRPVGGLRLHSALDRDKVKVYVVQEADGSS